MDEHNEAVMRTPLRRRRPRRLSELFALMAAEATGPITVAAIRDALGDRSFAALLVFFASFNLLPLPPGASIIFGAPLVIVSIQMVFGSRTAWLPKIIMEKSLDAERFRQIASKLIPRLEQLERWIRPRYWPFWRRQGDRVIGAIALVLAIAVVLPVPFGNWLPALATVLVGLALSERDGVLFAIGAVTGLASLAVIGAVVASAGAILSLLWSHMQIFRW
jgi:hypothetical protein